MKIYFAGSIRGGRQDAELYRKVIAVLKENHQVLTEHVGDLSLSTVEDKGDKAIYEQDTACVPVLHRTCHTLLIFAADIHVFRLPCLAEEKK